jgi:hypothetical protein
MRDPSSVSAQAARTGIGRGGQFKGSALDAGHHGSPKGTNAAPPADPDRTTIEKMGGMPCKRPHPKMRPKDGRSGEDQFFA